MDDFEEIVGSEDPRFQKMAEQIEVVGRDLGLYLEHIIARPHPAIPGKVMVMTNFRLGDVAFRARTIDPEKAKLDTEFRGITDSFEEQQWEEVRKRLAEGRPFDRKPDAEG